MVGFQEQIKQQAVGKATIVCQPKLKEIQLLA